MGSKELSAIEALTEEIRAMHPDAPLFRTDVRLPGTLVAGRVYIAQLNLGDVPMPFMVKFSVIDERRVRMQWQTGDGYPARDVDLRIFP